MKETTRINGARVREVSRTSRAGTNGNIYDATSAALFSLDRQGRICHLNDNGAGLLGFSAAWLVGRPFVVFVARQDVRRFLNFLTLALCSREETHVIDLDLFVGGRTHPIQLSMTTSPNSPVPHRMTAVEVADLRRTEELLRESTDTWYSMVQNAPDTIMTVEDNGRIGFVNKAIWGYSAGALVGTNLLDHVPEGEKLKVLQCLNRAFKYRKRVTCEINNSGRWFHVTFGPLQIKRRHDLPATSLILREISGQKKKEDTLRISGEQMREFAARLEAVREEERTRLAREIHDELGQALTGLKLDLSWIASKTSTSTAIRKRVKEMIVQVDETILQVRRISTDLRPAILDDLGLLPALEWQLSEFHKRTKIRTEIICNASELRLDAEAASAVFRVVQEGLTNVMRHAKASRVRMHIQVDNDVLCISIQDNGQGMPRKSRQAVTSLGIVGMRERISRLGGQFNIVSEPRKGTRLDILIPTT